MLTVSKSRSDLLLVAATILGTLAIHHHLEARNKAVPGQIAGGHVRHAQPFANSPLEVRSAGWKEIALRTYRRFEEDRVLAIAAGTVFYGLLAMFPAITAVVSSYGLFADPSTIAANLQSLAITLAVGSFAVVQDQVARWLAKGSAALSLTFAGSLVFALWSANAGMKAMIDALNVVYEEEESRGFLRLNLVSLGLTIAALAAILLMVGAVVAAPIALQHLGIDQHSARWIKYGRWPLLGVLVLFALAVLYRIGPSRKAPRWQWLSPGAAAACGLWLAGSSLLSWYLSNFGNYSATYGSLGAAIGLMMWMWLTSISVLYGAELNSEMERQVDLPTRA